MLGRSPLAVLAAIALAVALSGCTGTGKQSTATVGSEGSHAGSFALTSSTFGNGTTIPAANSCEGGEASPQLSITGAPAGTVSLALTMEDLDVKSDNHTLSHWVVWGIDPASATFPDDALPAGAAEGRNQVGKSGYLGPCPPKGAPAHHYRLTAIALDTRLTLPSSSTMKDLEGAMAGHILDRAELFGTYARAA